MYLHIIYILYIQYAQGLVYEVEGDGHLSPVGRTEESWCWPRSALLLLPSSLPLTSSLPLRGFNTQTQEDLLHVGSSVDSLAPKQSEAAYSDISLQGNILVSVITQVCQGLTGAVFKIFCEPLVSL